MVPDSLRRVRKHACQQGGGMPEGNRLHRFYLNLYAVVRLRKLRCQLESIHAAVVRDLRDDSSPVFLSQFSNAASGIGAENRRTKPASRPQHFKAATVVSGVCNKRPQVFSKLGFP